MSSNADLVLGPKPRPWDIYACNRQLCEIVRKFGDTIEGHGPPIKWDYRESSGDMKRSSCRLYNVAGNSTQSEEFLELFAIAATAHASAIGKRGYQEANNRPAYLWKAINKALSAWNKDRLALGFGGMKALKAKKWTAAYKELPKQATAALPENASLSDYTKLIDAEEGTHCDQSGRPVLDFDSRYAEVRADEDAAADFLIDPTPGTARKILKSKLWWGPKSPAGRGLAWKKWPSQYSAVGALTDKQAVAVAGHCCLGIPQKMIADRLGLTESAVSQRCESGLEALRLEVTEPEGDTPFKAAA